MFIPIIIPFNRYDDDDDRKHGHGCMCPECLEEKRLENLPREYYKYRYAIPKSFIVKNTIYKILSSIVIILGASIAISPLVLMSIIHLKFWMLVSAMPLGMLVVAGGSILYSVIVKDYSDCKDKIYIEIRDSFVRPESWDDKIKTMQIPKNYKLTKEVSRWRYK